MLDCLHRQMSALVRLETENPSAHDGRPHLRLAEEVGEMDQFWIVTLKGWICHFSQCIEKLVSSVYVLGAIDRQRTCLSCS